MGTGVTSVKRGPTKGWTTYTMKRTITGNTIAARRSVRRRTGGEKAVAPKALNEAAKYEKRIVDYSQPRLQRASIPAAESTP